MEDLGDLANGSTITTQLASLDPFGCFHYRQRNETVGRNLKRAAGIGPA